MKRHRRPVTGVIEARPGARPEFEQFDMPLVVVEAEVGAIPEEVVLGDVTGVVEWHELPDIVQDPAHACELRRFFTRSYR